MIKLPDFIQNNNLHENQRLRYNFAVAVCLSSADSPRKAARIRRWRVRQPGELWPGRFLVNGGTPPPVFPLGVHCCLPGPWDQSLKECWIPYALWRSSFRPRVCCVSIPTTVILSQDLIAPHISNPAPLLTHHVHHHRISLCEAQSDTLAPLLRAFNGFSSPSTV